MDVNYTGLLSSREEIDVTESLISLAESHPAGTNMPTTPPRSQALPSSDVPEKAALFLSRFLISEDIERVHGDLEECFVVRAQRSGIPAARRWYWKAAFDEAAFALSKRLAHAWHLQWEGIRKFLGIFLLLLLLLGLTAVFRDSSSNPSQKLFGVLTAAGLIGAGLNIGKIGIGRPGTIIHIDIRRGSLAVERSGMEMGLRPIFGISAAIGTVTLGGWDIGTLIGHATAQPIGNLMGDIWVHLV